MHSTSLADWPGKDGKDSGSADEPLASGGPPQLRRPSQHHFWEEDVGDYLHHEVPIHVRQARQLCRAVPEAPACSVRLHACAAIVLTVTATCLKQGWLQVWRRTTLARWAQAAPAGNRGG
jgi:hypothetical protein